jgi:hypothetical protein
VIGVLPGFPQAGGLVVEKEVLFETAGLQQALEQVIGEFHQAQPMTDFPMHLKAEDCEDQDRQDTEQEGQDDLAPNLIGGLFHE